jgi:hypothetical protein
MAQCRASTLLLPQDFLRSIYNWPFPQTYNNIFFWDCHAMRSVVFRVLSAWFDWQLVPNGSEPAYALAICGWSRPVKTDDREAVVCVLCRRRLRIGPDTQRPGAGEQGVSGGHLHDHGAIP